MELEIAQDVMVEKIGPKNDERKGSGEAKIAWAESPEQKKDDNVP